MTVYVVVEGEVEKIVYGQWIPRINPHLKQVYSLSKLTGDSFFMLSGHGYPQYMNMVAAAARDVQSHQTIDRLVISVDAEEKTVEQKRQELRDAVDRLPSTVDLRLVVANCCFESWALGNRRLFSNAIEETLSPELATYRTQYDIRDKDPELMPSLCRDKFNRARFAFQYLSLAVREQGKVYSKSNPYYVSHHKYFDGLMRRLADTEQMSTLREFVNAFH